MLNISVNVLCVCVLSGQDDYDRLRPLSYQDANLILVCYDVTNPTSYDNVLIKVHLHVVFVKSCNCSKCYTTWCVCMCGAQWCPEVNHFCRDVPVILIGCKTDLRKDKEKMRKLRALDLEPITYTQVSNDIMLS